MSAGTAVLTVPGNLLLLGEYAVLEPGGLGIAMAVERRVVLEVEAAKESTERATGLVGEIVRAVGRELVSHGRRDEAPRLCLRIDSSALFGADGRKIGLGSSAAVAVGIAFALLSDAGLEGAQLEESTLRAALDGHRSFQGGRGSGYDIAASLYGGFGLFVGGVKPSFERLEPTWMPPLRLARGPAPVDTARAIGRYEEWKLRSPGAARSFLEASNEIVRLFAAAESWAQASSRLREGSRLAADLGEEIGVPARIEGAVPLLDGAGCVAKALGAGDELVAVWREASLPAWVKAEVARAGPSWRQ